MNNQFKMDRTKVSATSFADADNHIHHLEHKTVEERLNAACFVIYNIYATKQHTKVYRTVISERKHQHNLINAH